ncbi:ExbD/TolR family protein [Thiohalorhabdus sp.]|uniref:ExbD/TolR family protein n=1 Tax=Thiohalorhabdus sp. TaxID=3094134 RepID=UPI002FC3770F
MAFGQQPGDPGEPISDINVTPLVDVMLVLLVIFIVMAPLFAQALRVDLPQAEAAPSAEPVVADLTLAAGGGLSLDGEPVSAAKAAERLARRQAEAPELVVRLSADEAVPYGEVAKLLARIREAGVARLAFRTRAP